jgi:hypothetical protein
MAVYTFNPLEDRRWAEFVQRHPLASVAHSPGWLEALRRTYGYEPVVYTTSPPTADLTNGVVFCRISSWLTGRRMVSLPFTDHCEPLMDHRENRPELLIALRAAVEKESWKYVEIRPVSSGLDSHTAFGPATSCYLHRLDLRPKLAEIFKGLHKGACQDMIRRAEREALHYEAGNSEALLDKFYQLLLLTRRRHHLPPHPRAWFQNLIDCLGDGLQIRVASKDGQPIASILTLSYKGSIVYKYGCSDLRFHKAGGMAHLLWTTIREARAAGLCDFDLGRSDRDNHGLITFKDRWGATPSVLTYVRYPASCASRNGAGGWTMNVAKEIFARVPDRVLVAAGKSLYKHIG